MRPSVDLLELPASSREVPTSLMLTLALLLLASFGWSMCCAADQAAAAAAVMLEAP